MSNLGQSGTRTWVELPAVTADAMPQPGYLVGNGVDPFSLIGGTTSVQGAALVEAQAVGVYDVLFLLDRLILVAVGAGVVQFSTTGTAVAQFVANGAGRYDVSDDLTADEEAAFYALGSNSRYAIASIGGTDEGLSIVTTGGDKAQLYL